MTEVLVSLLFCVFIGAVVLSISVISWEQIKSTKMTVAKYWSRVENHTDLEKLEGLVFSFLCLIDGVSGEMPAFELYPAPHPSDKEFHISEGENYWDKDLSLHGDNYLHESGLMGERSK